MIWSSILVKSSAGIGEYVSQEIQEINEIVVAQNGLLKVIFENDYLQDTAISSVYVKSVPNIRSRLSRLRPGMVLSSRQTVCMRIRAATDHHLKLMREHCAASVQIKAAGGVRTLDDLPSSSQA